jgi:histidinol-phosphatase
LEDALVCYTSSSAFDEHDLGDAFRVLARRCWAARGFSDFWGHVLVAEGSADVAVEPVMNLWDNAAIKVIVEEAGGRFSDLDGAVRADGGNALSTNGVLHDAALAAMRA